MEFKNRLKDQYTQSWSSVMFAASSSINYRLYKTEYKLENYLAILPPKLRQVFVNFRLNNNYLPVITGQWRNIPRKERVCDLCNMNAMADDIHYLFVCDCNVKNKLELNIFPRNFIKTQIVSNLWN